MISGIRELRLRFTNHARPPSTIEGLHDLISKTESPWDFFLWSSLSSWLNNGVSRAIYIIPVAGYVILYSDFFEHLFAFEKQLGPRAWMTTYGRVTMAYFGSLALLLGWVLYRIFSPHMVRTSKDVTEFVRSVIETRDMGTARQAARQINAFTEVILPATYHNASLSWFNSLKASIDQILGSVDDAFNWNSAIQLLRGYYHWQNASVPTMRAIIWVLVFLGYGLLAIPSIDLFTRVVRSLLIHTIPPLQ